jgi:hypothetical protein
MSRIKSWGWELNPDPSGDISRKPKILLVYTADDIQIELLGISYLSVSE